MYGLMVRVGALGEGLILGLALEPLYSMVERIKDNSAGSASLFGFVQVMKYGRKHQM